MKLKAAFLFLLLSSVVLGFDVGDDVAAWVSQLISSEAEDPIPIVELYPREYQVKVRTIGILTGLDTQTVVTPPVRESLKVAWLVPEGALVKPGDILVRFDNTNAQISLEKNENSVASLSQKIRKSEKEWEGRSGSLEIERTAAELEFRFAQRQIRQDEEIFSEWEIQESLVSAALAEYKRENLEERGRLQQEVTQSDLEMLQIDQKQAQTEVSQARNTLAKLEISSPTSGVVLHKKIGYWDLEVGREVWPGNPLVEIAALDKFQGELRIAETDIAGITPGLPVAVGLHALPGRTFEGKLTTLTKIAEQVDQLDPRRYFTAKVTLAISPEVLGELRPGMGFTAEILVKKRESAFVVPKSAVFKEDNGFVVYLDKGENYEAQQISILENDHGFYIVDGLEPAQKICLRHPFEKEKLHLPDFSAPSGASSARRFVVFF